jgi:ring-1,2-phenylacetyl-CoA epoxidase subunit PaaC
LSEATLRLPESRFAHTGGKTGARHTEHLGLMLAMMQVLPRSHPDAVW